MFIIRYSHQACHADCILLQHKNTKTLPQGKPNSLNFCARSDSFIGNGQFRHINGKLLTYSSQNYTKFWASSDLLFFRSYLRTIQKNRNKYHNKIRSLCVSENTCCLSVKNGIVNWRRGGQIPPRRFRDLFNDTVPSAKISYVFFSSHNKYKKEFFDLDVNTFL